jgi:hypothetical protein
MLTYTAMETTCTTMMQESMPMFNIIMMRQLRRLPLKNNS